MYLIGTVLGLFSISRVVFVGEVGEGDEIEWP